MNVAKVAHLTGHSNAIYSLEKSIYQNNIYSSSADGFIVEWDIEKKGDGKLYNADVADIIIVAS